MTPKSKDPLYKNRTARGADDNILYSVIELLKHRLFNEITLSLFTYKSGDRVIQGKQNPKRLEVKIIHYGKEPLKTITN